MLTDWSLPLNANRTKGMDTVFLGRGFQRLFKSRFADTIGGGGTSSELLICCAWTREKCAFNKIS